MKILPLVLSGCVLLALVLLASSIYVVSEWEQVIVTEFGKPVGEPVTEPGLYFKTPFIQTATSFEKRILEWDGDSKEVLTGDKVAIMVNTTARWKIVEPLKFYKALRSIDKGQGVLDEKIGSAVQKVIKSYPLMEALRNTQRELEYTTVELKAIETAKNISISVGRDTIVGKILEMAREGLSEQYGIELVDVQIKQINYVEAVISKIYQRMRSERRRIKDRYEAEGTKRREEIEGGVDRDKAKLESEGYRESKEIRGKADATALRIYAEAYQQDPEFYSFIKTLETYEETLGKDTHLILSTDSEFFRYLKDFMRE